MENSINYSSANELLESFFALVVVVVVIVVVVVAVVATVEREKVIGLT